VSNIDVSFVRGHLTLEPAATHRHQQMSILWTTLALWKTPQQARDLLAPAGLLPSRPANR